MLFLLSLSISILDNTQVMTNPIIAGIIPATITDVKDTPKFSDTAMVLGLGDIIFPALTHHLS